MLLRIQVLPMCISKDGAAVSDKDACHLTDPFLRGLGHPVRKVQKPTRRKW